MGKKTKTNYNSVRNVALLKSFTRIQRFPFEICQKDFVHATFQSMFGSAKYFLSVGRKTQSADKKIYRQGTITISQYITFEPTTLELPSKNHQW